MARLVFPVRLLARQGNDSRTDAYDVSELEELTANIAAITGASITNAKAMAEQILEGEQVALVQTDARIVLQGEQIQPS